MSETVTYNFAAAQEHVGEIEPSSKIEGEALYQPPLQEMPPSGYHRDHLLHGTLEECYSRVLDWDFGNLLPVRNHHRHEDGL